MNTAEGKTFPLRGRDGEIDLFDLVKVVWRWRILISSLTLLGLLAGFGYAVIKSRTESGYIARVDVQIGKVANVSIESAGDTYAFLQSDQVTKDDDTLRKMKVAFNDFRNMKYPQNREEKFQLNKDTGANYTTVVSLFLKGRDREKILKSLEAAANKLLERHARFYSDAEERLGKIKSQHENLSHEAFTFYPLLIIDSYTYPTRITRSAEVQPVSKKRYLVLIPALTAFFAFAAGFLLALLIEWARGQRKTEGG